MSGGRSSKDVIKLRTFAADLARAKVSAPVSSLKKTKEIEPVNEVVTPKEPEKEREQQKPAPLKTETTLTREIKAAGLESIDTAPKESILVDQTASFEGTDVSSGNIIRETKRKRFRLFPAMIESVEEWFKQKQKTYDEKHPTHYVARAEVRKETIEEAAKGGEFAPRDDFNEVAKRMKEKERVIQSSTFSLRKKTEVKPSGWTHIVEKETDTAKMEEGKEEEVATEVPQPQAEVKPQEIQSAEQMATSTQVKEVPKPSLEINTQAVQENIVVKKEKKSVRTVAQRETSVPSPSRLIHVSIAVCVVASVLGIATSFYFFGGKDTVTEKPAIVFKIPALIRAEKQEAFILPQDRNALLYTLSEKVVNTSGITQLYPTVSTENGEMPAPTEAIFEVFSPRVPGSFIRNSSEITFGGVRGVPFILMRTLDFETAFAGMLAWEKIASADLAPLFGNTVTETFDPEARTDTQVLDPFFKDIIVGNKNARVLLDGKGQDRVIYTFTDKNTLLITTSREALEALVPFVQ